MMNMEVPDYYERVSLRLVRVLDTSGLGEKIRWKRIEMLIQDEELDKYMHSSYKVTCHKVGSQAEATTTWGLGSDTDKIFCHDRFTVLQDLHYWEVCPNSYLMITDGTTPPGYVKLQRVYDDVPIPVCNIQDDFLMLDTNGRSVLRNDSSTFKKDIADEHHGPANTNHGLFGPEDRVVAIRSLSWPHPASEWITRPRQHNWPSQETVSIIQQSGTLLVPVGQQLSPERHIEWRISFTYGEKILVWQFNSTQYKCYVLLKIIKKYFITSKVGDNVLTSYHCKTCMFYMIESTAANQWQPQNLLTCIELCLRKLCNWVEEGNCPNYFIPAENMFLGKVDGPIQTNLLKVLRDLLRQKGNYLTRIPCDEIGWKLTRVCQSPLTHIDSENQDYNKLTALIVTVLLSNVWVIWFRLLHAGEIDFWVLELTSSSHVRHEVNTILRTFCCSSLGSYLASKYLEEEVTDQEGLNLAQEFLLLGSSSDVASGKLKLAAFHLMQNNAIFAENILQNIEQNYTFLVCNVQTEVTKNQILLRIVNENLSTTELVRNYSAYPVPYLPSEIHCTPRSLIPEMFRLTGSYQGSIDPDTDCWQSWAVVDPIFYLHFLEYLCCHQQNKIHQKMASVDNMIWVIRYVRLKYKDTALNLLAYCLKMEGLIIQAYKVLSKSMKLKNHNAAKWHIGCLTNSAYGLMGNRR